MITLKPGQKGVKTMFTTTLPTTLQEQREKREAIEFIENYQELTESEKQQVRGVMVGIRLARMSRSAVLAEATQA